MKIKTTIMAALLITNIALARIISPFPGWDRLKEISTSIIIVHDKEPTPSEDQLNDAPKFDSKIDIVSFLKGTNDTTSARLLTSHSLKQDEYYLVMGYCVSGVCHASEEYRVIPLGVRFSTNSIAGKPLDEQLQILFLQSIDNLNHEIQKDEEEKARLESGLKK